MLQEKYVEEYAMDPQEPSDLGKISRSRGTAGRGLKYPDNPRRPSSQRAQVVRLRGLVEPAMQQTSTEIEIDFFRPRAAHPSVYSDPYGATRTASAGS